MTTLLDPPDSGATPPAVRRRWSWSWAGIALMAILGLVVVLYPTMASWFSARAQESVVDTYLEGVEQVPDHDKVVALASARAYNAGIPEILLSDPYTMQDAREGRGGAYETYLEQLKLAGSDVMARVRIPSISVNLPIFHGTDDAVLDRGAGHLFGGSLPVGGPGTHAVITAHSGLISAVMFDDLEQVGVGDTVVIDVAGETLIYQVTATQVVEPTEVSDLALEPGADLLTLVTCTPTGVNTHRLLVHASRVPDEAVTAPTRTLIEGSDGVAGFPWWIPILLGGIALVLLVVRWLRRTPLDRPGGRHRLPSGRS